MIFARRALQHRLDSLRAILDDITVDHLAARLNRVGKDRHAAMWEVAILHGLSKYGALRNEQALSSGRRPDITFAGGNVAFIADITAVSDEGLDDDNPYRELSDAIEAAKNRLGLPIGGMDLRVDSKSLQTNRGTRTALQLPHRKRIQDFVRDEIVPRLREQITAGAKVLAFSIDDQGVGITVTINPEKSPISTGGFAAYDVPTIKDRNPLFSALKAKAKQLSGAKGYTGIIVGDGDCAALRQRQNDRRAVSTDAIASELVRQYSSIGFVLMITVGEEQRIWPQLGHPQRWLEPLLVVRENAPKLALEALFRSMIGEMPQPIMMPVNGAMRAREADYHIGHHGGYRMENNKVRISARELVEILAGHRSIEDDGAKYVVARPDKQRRLNPIQIAFGRNLAQGRLPESINVIKTGEDDNDDWIEFEFGDSDPAISPLR